MRASAARGLLQELVGNAAFEQMIDPARSRKIAQALASVVDELPQKQLSQVVAKISDSIQWALLFDAARKDPSEPARSLIAKAIKRQRDDLRARFFTHAHSDGAGAEAAAFVVDTARSPHLPSLLKRLAKMPPPSKALLSAAAHAMGAAPKKDWFDLVNFLPCCALLGVLVKDGTPASLKLVDRVATALERQLADDKIHEPAATVERIRAALGSPRRVVERKKKKKAPAKSNPVCALATAQGFSVAGKSDWRASIWLAKGEPNEWFGAMQRETQLYVELNAKSKPYWCVTIRKKSGYDRYSNTSGEVTQDDLGLPPLRQLRQLPAWLPAAGEAVKTTFSPDKAKISAGRYRKLVAELRAWLERP